MAGYTPGATAPPAYGYADAPPAYTQPAPVAYPGAAPQAPVFGGGGYSGYNQPQPATQVPSGYDGGKGYVPDAPPKPSATAPTEVSRNQLMRQILASSTITPAPAPSASLSRGSRAVAQAPTRTATSTPSSPGTPQRDPRIATGCKYCDRPLQLPTRVPSDWGEGKLRCYAVLAVFLAALQIAFHVVFLTQVVLDGEGHVRPFKAVCTTMEESGQFLCFISVGIVARGIFAFGAASIGVVAMGGGALGLVFACGQGSGGTGMSFGQITCGSYSVGQLVCAFYRARWAQVGFHAVYPLTELSNGNVMVTVTDCCE